MWRSGGLAPKVMSDWFPWSLEVLSWVMVISAFFGFAKGRQRVCRELGSATEAQPHRVTTHVFLGSVDRRWKYRIQDVPRKHIKKTHSHDFISIPQRIFLQNLAELVFPKKGWLRSYKAPGLYIWIFSPSPCLCKYKIDLILRSRKAVLRCTLTTKHSQQKPEPWFFETFGAGLGGAAWCAGCHWGKVQNKRSSKNGAEGGILRSGIGSSGCTDALILCVPYILQVYYLLLYGFYSPWQVTELATFLRGLQDKSEIAGMKRMMLAFAEKTHRSKLTVWQYPIFLVRSIPQNYLIYCFMAGPPTLFKGTPLRNMKKAL